MPRGNRPRSGSQTNGMVQVPRGRHGYSNSVSSSGGFYNPMLYPNYTFDETVAPTLPQRTELPMSPASRHSKNLKVLHRHDPTIHTIIDQWGLVTLYELQPNGEWDNLGVEGPMFIFERDPEPRYGFCVLNRVGLEDYFRYLSASDTLEDNEKLLFYRFGDPPCVLGLWTQSTQNELGDEPKQRLADTMIQLNRCLKKGLRYAPLSETPTLPHSSQNESNALSALFAKLGSDTASTPEILSGVDTVPFAKESQPNLRGPALLSSIFASASNHASMIPPRAELSRPNKNPLPPSVSPLPNPTPPPPPPIPSTHPHPEPYSPRPQILTTSIIDALMGVDRSSGSGSADDEGGEHDSGLGAGLTKGLGALGIGINFGNAVKDTPSMQSHIGGSGVLTPVATPTPLSDQERRLDRKAHNQNINSFHSSRLEMNGRADRRGPHTGSTSPHKPIVQGRNTGSGGNPTPRSQKFKLQQQQQRREQAHPSDVTIIPRSVHLRAQSPNAPSSNSLSPPSHSNNLRKMKSDPSYIRVIPPESEEVLVDTFVSYQHGNGNHYSTKEAFLYDLRMALDQDETFGQRLWETYGRRRTVRKPGRAYSNAN